MPRRHPNSIAMFVAAMLVGNVAAQDHHERHNHRFANDVDAFHSALAPLWHAPAGKERSQEVCANTVLLESRAREIRSADSKPLLASLATLRTQCRDDPSDIDRAFSRVHDAFHRLVEPSGH